MCESIKINNFISLSSVEIELKDITIVLGPQASGKSLIARLLFFCREYIDDLFRQGVVSDLDKKTFDKDKRKEFSEIFPRYSWSESIFDVCYKIDDFEVTIEHNNRGHDISLKTSSNIASAYAAEKRKFRSLKNEAVKSDRQKRLLPVSLRYQMSLVDHPRSFPLPATLFVPANRSIFSLLEDRFFTILDLDSGFDKVITNFGRFFETAKRIYLDSRNSSDSNGENDVFELIEKITCGYLVSRKGEEWIKSERGEVELKKASSGQQEALPLLIAIVAFPRLSGGSKLVIAEEPEAHLFPEAQTQIVDLVEIVQKSKDTNFFFTTHSPYFVSYFNNKIIKYNDNDLVAAYFVDRGHAVSMMDEDTGLIDASQLDDISVFIAEDFEASLNE